MTPLDPTVCVRVDLRNPGQFLACCGLLELADRLWGGAEGWFDRTGTFRVAPLLPEREGQRRDLIGLLETLLAAPFEAVLSVRNLSVPAIIAPLRLELGTHPDDWLWLSFWMRLRADRNEVLPIGTRWQLWAGQQTPLRLWRDLREALIGLLPRIVAEPERVFAHRRPGGGRFGYDPGPAWNALDAGFSPNEQKMEVASSPAVEMLAAVGLQRFRPEVSGEGFLYAPWSQRLAPACAALVATSAGAYRAQIVSRGQYGALSMAIPI